MINGNENNKTISSTMTAKDIINADNLAKYDAQVKNILANKEILARILKHAVVEFKDCSIKDIRDKYIEGFPLVGEVEVFPGSTNSKIQGLNTEIKIVGEGETTFDVLFNVITPQKHKRIKINIEANKDSSPGYEIQTRGVYYGSRVLSSEYGREFENMDYDKLVKTYSIWICTEPPKSEENSIATIHFNKEDVVNSISMNRESYDLIEVIIIHLNQDCHKEADYLVGMLSTLLSDTISVQEKLQLLEDKYGIPMVEENEKGVKKMCNLGQALWDKAKQEGIYMGEHLGRQKSIIELLEDLGKVPSKVVDVIKDESDMDVLKRWNKLVARSSSVEEFVSRM